MPFSNHDSLTMTEALKFLKKLDSRKPIAFVLGSGACHGLAFIRSLGRKGIPVVAINTVKGPGLLLMV